MRRLILASLFLIGSSLSAQTSLYGHSKIRDFYFTFTQSNWWTLLLNSLSTKQDLKADLIVDGQVYQDIGIRIKGASSNLLPGNKKPFNLTMDSFKPGQTLYGSTTLNLNNGAMDPTLTREVTAYEIFRSYLPTPRTAYVRVHLNGTYWGIYILVEQPNKAMLRAWFEEDDGSRYKADRPSGVQVGSSPLTWLGSSALNYQQNYELKTPSHANAWKDLINLCDKLNNTPSQQFQAEIVKWADVDRALWCFACHNLIVNSDDYMGAGHNYYIYFDPSDGRLNMIPWDQNEAYGVHWPSTNQHTYSITHNSTSSSRPLVSRLLAVPEWRETYYAHYRTLLRRWSDWNTQIGPLTTRLQDLIRADVQRDPNYLYTMTQFDPAYKGQFWSVFHWIPGLKDLVIARRSFLLQQPDLAKPEPQLSNATYPKAEVQPGQKVQVTAMVTGNPAVSSVSLRSSVVGTYQDNPMFDDGQHGDGKANDGVWGGTFIAGRAGQTMRFYIAATNSAGTVAFLPEAAEQEHFELRVAFPLSTSPVVINELLADNDTGDKDEQGEYEDWVEIYNRGSVPYDLSGHWLSDNPDLPRKWMIPASTTVPAQGFLRIWCDNEPAEGKYHATFKLDKEGERLALYDTDTRGNTHLDGVAFGPQKGDRSFGRLPDGANLFYYLWDPTGAKPAFVPGDHRRYDGRITGSAYGLKITGIGLPLINQTFALQVSGGPGSGLALLLVSAGTGGFDMGPLGYFALDPSILLPFFFRLDATGGALVTLKVPASYANRAIATQVFAQDLSNALAVWFK